MITLTTVLYVASILLVFKVLKVPARPWPIAGFVVLGVLLIGTIVVLWSLACPMTGRAIVNRHVIQIVTYDKGRVVSFPAVANVPLKKGDTLFQVDPAPFQDAVDQLAAELESAKNNVGKAQAALDAANASVKAGQANVVSTKTVYDDRLKLQAAGVGAVATEKVVEAGANYTEAKASLREAQANVVQSTSALAVAKSNVVSVKSQLDDAQFNLKVSTVRAPSDGIVTDWQIRPGTFVVPIALASVGTFIDTTETFIIASFPGEELLYVKPGQSVEMAFNTRPGELFQGKVENILQATGE